MPRNPTIDSSDRIPRCFLCFGTGQVANPEVPGTLMTCPACNGVGRVNPDGYDKSAVARYRANVRNSINLG